MGNLSILQAMHKINTWLQVQSKPQIKIPQDRREFARSLFKMLNPKLHYAKFPNTQKAEKYIKKFAAKINLPVNRAIPPWVEAKIPLLPKKINHPPWNSDWTKSYGGFYLSAEWKQIRYGALKRDKGICQCCGASAATGARMNVDHVEPLSKRWDLRLTLSNLQVLCADCNEGKGGNDRTNWRENDPPYPENVVSFSKWHGL